ncbi:MAG: mechanosensitive ion channel domain-containing protein, partial [Myxococcota bacterium]
KRLLQKPSPSCVAEMATAGDAWRAFHEYVLEPARLTGADIAAFARHLPQFLVVLLLFVVAGRVVVWLLSRTVLSPKRVDPMLTRLVGQLLMVFAGFVGFSVALLAFGINILGLAVTLGLIGAALALGLQNTVANIMGGISLVLDKPFEVGDRIRIGEGARRGSRGPIELWGDVEQIGLRSTRILTTRREYVIVPNRLMDEREIWNYTKRFPELRVDIDVTISYDSDLPFAKGLLEQIATEHSKVLAFPAPRTMTGGFGDKGVELQLRCFIGDARELRPVESELRDRIKAAFDQNGIEIPFPYRTIVYKHELPPPRHTDEAPPRERPLRKRRVLVATAGTTPALSKAQTITRIAQELDADIVVCYIVPKDSLVSRREGERAADIFQAAAREVGLAVRLVVEEGPVVETISAAAEREHCGAVLIGAPRSPVLLAWKNANVEERLRHALSVPLVVVPPSLAVDAAEVRAARAALDAMAPAEARGSGESTQ